MKAKIYLIPAVFFMLVFTLNSKAQDKYPVATNDSYQALANQQIEMHVLDNDWAYENHPFKILQVLGEAHGDYSFNDSLIFYTPSMYFGGIDSLTYRILDEENNLISDMAKVYIEVENHGYAFLDVNQVNCRLNSCGNQFWDIMNYASYEVPANSGIMSIFMSSMWIGGYDANDQLHLAGERYRMNGGDFYPGPVMNHDAYSEEQDLLWNRVWKLNFSDIMYHQQHWQDSGYEPIKNIAEWPANGNTALGQAAKLAPYYDLNGDGTYNPLDGDCPMIKGDQAVYVLYNDDRGDHIESGGRRLGAEIQVMYYAKSMPEDTAMKYTIFADVNIINRSDTNYSDVYVSNFIDFDIGYPLDDYIGCDTLLNSGYAYNGLPADGNGGADTYGNHPPAQAFTLLNAPMSTFSYFSNVAEPGMTDPAEPNQYYNYMTGRWKDSTQLIYGGTGYGTGTPTSYAFSGDPATGEGWIEEAPYCTPGDRRALVTTGPYDLPAADTVQYTFALIFARDYQGNHLASVDKLKQSIASVRDYYEKTLGVNEHSFATQPISASVYPNPFSNYIEINCDKNQDSLQYAILDMLGETIDEGTLESGETRRIVMNRLKNGLYFIRLTNGEQILTKKIIKTRF